MNLAVIGLQFGDEGKGKIVDYLSPRFNIIARYCGGSNAGHTVIHNGKDYKLHLVPSGVLQGKIGVLGNGMVIDPITLRDEVSFLRDEGFKTEIFISSKAHVVTPLHREMDAIEERKRNIGTTKRGIGPAYETKVKRVGIRVADLLDRDLVFKKLTLISMLWDLKREEKELKKMAVELHSIGLEFKEQITDTEMYLLNAMDSGKSVLFEGAQGFMLDIDFGTYPYVTSSHTSALGISPGLGIPFRRIDRILGVAKVYTTRVGEGPFPTELHGEFADMLREKGKEYGATTGRPRRVGWLDLPMLRYATRINDVDEIALTKADVLSELPQVSVAMEYLCDGRIYPYPPPYVERCKVKYITMPGWKNLEDNSFRNYVELIEKNTGAKVTIISYGPKRGDTMEL